MEVKDIRKDFPVLGEGVIYLDNTATTLKPVQVLEQIVEYYLECGANIYRGQYELSEKATAEYENAREKIADFVNAEKEELVFNRNTTEGLNQVALGLGFEKEDRILVGAGEHHSNMLPWRKTKAGVEYVFPDEKGKIETEDIQEKITGETKLVAINHVSNVTGAVNPVGEIGEICREKDCLLAVDGAQAVPHMQVDVSSIGCDFYAFSGHKMLGPAGIGGLYVEKEAQEELAPVYVGGGCIDAVTFEEYFFKENISRYEAGTPNIGGAIGLARAVGYLQEIGWNFIEQQEQRLTEQMIKGLSSLENVELVGSEKPEDRLGIACFKVKGRDSHEVARALDQKRDICVRSGMHCAHPYLSEVVDIGSTVRASPYFYNTMEEIDALIEEIEKMD